MHNRKQLNVINPRRACAAKVTLVVLCVCLSVCLSVHSASHFSNIHSCQKRYYVLHGGWRSEILRKFSVANICLPRRSPPFLSARYIYNTNIRVRVHFTRNLTRDVYAQFRVPRVRVARQGFRFSFEHLYRLERPLAMSWNVMFVCSEGYIS